MLRRAQRILVCLLGADRNYGKPELLVGKI
jgi:hypothetical protein